MNALTDVLNGLMTLRDRGADIDALLAKVSSTPDRAQEWEPCSDCQGVGFTTRWVTERDGSEWPVSDDCPTCHRTGMVRHAGATV